jgi:DNA-binding NarL/FixJ family response regulator/Tfp pilus assembly protein PilZ
MSKPLSNEAVIVLKNKSRPEFMSFVQKNLLSARESDVLASLLARIISNDEIASLLDLSPNTVSNHLKSIYAKTSTLNKTELMCFFAQFCLNHLDLAKRYAKVPRVLIIDDEEDITELLHEGLSAYGLKVESTTDAAEGLKLYEKNRHDVIVSDINMPNKSGLDLIRNVKIDMGANPLFIFITGHADFTKEQCMGEGAADFVTKPCKIEDLYQRIVFNYIESAEEKGRYIGVDPKHFEQLSYKILRKFDLSHAQLGHGGMFIPAKENELNLAIEKMVGTKVKFTHQIDGDTNKLSIMGEISWLRSKDCEEGPAGIGLRYILMSNEDQLILDEWVRRNGVIAFIPLGKQDDFYPIAS